MAKFKSTFKTRWTLLALVVVFCAVSVSGCASFRKKFVRKKKAKSQTEEFAPVLVPVEYPRPDLSPGTVYKDHYYIAKAYLRDLDDVIGSRNATDKQQLYIMAQVAGRMGQMAALLVDGGKKSTLEGLRLQMNELTGQYDQPEGVRRYDLIKDRVRHIDREFHRSFKPALVQEDLKKDP